jgi:hypothetical protein
MTLVNPSPIDVLSNVATFAINDIAIVMIGLSFSKGVIAIELHKILMMGEAKREGYFGGTFELKTW